jgi:hypothetical protein
MENEHPYPACPSCSGDAFISLPEVAFEAHKSVTALGLPAIQRSGTWRATMVICARCGRTDLFTKDAEELAGRIPGSVRFRGVPPRPA